MFMNNTDIKFSENVVLLDVAFLNGWVSNVRQIMGERLGRELPRLDLVEWLTCLLLDAGVRGEGNEVQVLLLHAAGGDKKLECCVPDSLAELDGKACATPLGEFSFACVTAEGLATDEHLYFDLLTLLLNSENLKTLLLLPSAEVADEKLEDLMVQAKKDMGAGAEKNLQCTHWFRMAPPEHELPCQWCLVTYSLAYMLDINF